MIKYLRFVFAIILVFILLNCGSEKPGKTNKESMKSSENKSNTGKTSKIYKIKEIRFLKKPVEGFPIEVEVEFENEPKGDYNLVYEWYLNNNLVEEVNSNVLDPEFFEKGQWIFCRVKAVGKDFETSFVKSKYYKILPSKPSIVRKPIPQFKIPGTFTYQVEVNFPGIEREDWEEELNFEIVSPDDSDLSISPEGLIEWELTQDKIKEYGNKLTIEFRVSSLDGREITGKINLNIK